MTASFSRHKMICSNVRNARNWLGIEEGEKVARYFDARLDSSSDQSLQVQYSIDDN